MGEGYRTSIYPSLVVSSLQGGGGRLGTARKGEEKRGCEDKPHGVILGI